MFSMSKKRDSPKLPGTLQFLSVVVGSVVGDVLPSAPGFTVVVVVLHFLGPEMAAALNRKITHFSLCFNLAQKQRNYTLEP